MVSEITTKGQCDFRLARERHVHSLSIHIERVSAFCSAIVKCCVSQELIDTLQPHQSAPCAPSCNGSHALFERSFAPWCPAEGYLPLPVCIFCDTTILTALEAKLTMMAGMTRAMPLHTPAAPDLLTPQRAQLVQRTPHRQISCSAVSAAYSAACEPMQLHSSAAAAAHWQYGGRRASTACHARKPTAPAGKVEEAADVAAGAYQGLPVIWQVCRCLRCRIVAVGGHDLQLYLWDKCIQNEARP